MTMLDEQATALIRQKCRPCEGGIPALDQQRIESLLHSLPGWQQDGAQIRKTWRFANFHETMAFVNAVAWVAHREDHHPDLEVTYNTCTVRYSTHSIRGLSENDFICAAKVQQLLS